MNNNRRGNRQNSKIDQGEKKMRQVIITGAARGLGREIVKKHLELGDTVWACARRENDFLHSMKEKYDKNLRLLLCDLGDSEQVTNAWRALAEEAVRVDLIYNVAGTAYVEERTVLSETDIDKCLPVFNVNALGILRVLKETVPFLQKGSVVVNVTSEAGSITACPRSAEYGYCMSKAAANMASRLFDNQYGKAGIRTLCVHPGWVKTDMGGKEAMESENAIWPGESAEAIVRLALKVDRIPEDVMYLDYQGNELPW